jgi:hypothetical protein
MYCCRSGKICCWKSVSFTCQICRLTRNAQSCKRNYYECKDT